MTERPDIVERLVTLATCGAFGRGDAEVMLTAADEIVRLRALITEWAAAMGDKADSFGGLVRDENARVALREEANR